MESGLPPIIVSPRPSRQLSLILSGLQMITGLVLVLAPIPVPVKIVLLSGLALQIFTAYRKRSSGQPQQLRIDCEHGVRLVYADGRVQKTRLRGDSVITPVALLLRFEGSRWWRPTSLLLGPDSLSDDELRRLRVLLRFGGSAPESPQ